MDNDVVQELALSTYRRADGQATLAEFDQGAEHTLSAAFARERDAIGAQLLSLLVFAFALEQRDELERSGHLFALLAVIFGVYFLLIWINEEIHRVSEQKVWRRVELAHVIVKVLWIVMTFTSVLFVRMVSDRLTGGPSNGRFSVVRLIAPLAVFLLIYIEFRVTNFRTAYVSHKVAALVDEHDKAA